MIQINQIKKRKSMIQVIYLKKTDLDAKITEIENKIPSIAGLATNSTLAAVEDKIPSVRNLVKKTDYDTRISDIQKKIADHNHMI